MAKVQIFCPTEQVCCVFDSQLVHCVSSQEPLSSLKRSSLKGLNVFRSVFVIYLQSNKVAALISARMHSSGDGVSCPNTTRGGQRRRANLDRRQIDLAITKVLQMFKTMPCFFFFFSLCCLALNTSAYG